MPHAKEIFPCAIGSPALVWALIAGLSPQRAGFNHRLIRMGFVAYEVALGQVYLPVLLLSPVSIIPPLLHTRSFICDLCCVKLPLCSNTVHRNIFIKHTTAWAHKTFWTKCIEIWCITFQRQVRFLSSSFFRNSLHYIMIIYTIIKPRLTSKFRKYSYENFTGHQIHKIHNWSV